MNVRFLSLIQTRFIIATVFIVALIMFLSFYYEVLKGREELFSLMQKEAYSLAESIERSSNIVISSAEHLEEQLNERLFSISNFLAHLDAENLLSQKELRKYCKENEIYNVSIYDRNGNLVKTNDPLNIPIPDKRKISRMLYPIFSGEKNRIVIGIEKGQTENSGFYIIATQRKHVMGGAILLSVNLVNISDIRASIGIGRLMKEIGNNGGIEYILIQDTIGIIAASKTISEISRIESEDFLKTSIQKDTILSRITTFQGKDIFEVVKPLFMNKEFIGLIRIGLSIDELQALESRMKGRVFILTLVIIALTILTFLVVLINQNLQMSQKRIKDVETFTSNILENMQDAVVTIDLENRVMIFNKGAEKLFGIQSDLIVGKRLSEINIKCMDKIFSSTMPGTEMLITCPDNTEHNISISMTKMGTSITAVIRDITETKRLQQEVERKEKFSALGKLAGQVAHEIRNPLNAINMIAQRYDKEFKPVQNLQEYEEITKVLLKELQRVNKIIQQFLLFARPPEPNFSETTLKELINHVAKLFENQASSKGIILNYWTEGDGIIKVDSNQMTQALLNLLQNALDATEKGGNITLSAKITGLSANIEVIDNGRGIPPEDINKIFDLYYTTKPNGTGMGLAITQQIINQHKGTIKVDSKIGVGTIFTINIPCNP